MRVQRWALALACLLAPLLAVADDREFYGAPLPPGTGVPISQAVADFGRHGGTPRRFSGRIVGVCQKKGCWAMLEDDGRAARVTFTQHGFHVPRDVTGPAEVYGVLERRQLTPEQVEHMRAEDPSDRPVEAVEYRIVAEGIEILG